MKKVIYDPNTGIGILNTFASEKDAKKAEAENRAALVKAIGWKKDNPEAKLDELAWFLRKRVERQTQDED